MEIKKIKELLDLVEESNFDEVELQEPEFRIRVRKNTAYNQQKADDRPARKEIVKEDVKKDENNIVIKSPLVGTFYRAASPESEPFVKLGDYIKSGQILCIVEAMKLMNEIESETDGFLRSILLDNAQPVEYGEPLFVIEKN